MGRLEEEEKTGQRAECQTVHDTNPRSESEKQTTEGNSLNAVANWSKAEKQTQVISRTKERGRPAAAAAADDLLMIKHSREIHVSVCWCVSVCGCGKGGSLEHHYTCWVQQLLLDPHQL